MILLRLYSTKKHSLKTKSTQCTIYQSDKRTESANRNRDGKKDDSERDPIRKAQARAPITEHSEFLEVIICLISLIIPQLS